MADIFTPPPITNIPTGAQIPQEYQDQIDAAKRRQMIAQALQQMALSNKGPQQIGPVAAKISPLASLANIGQAGLGGYLDNQAMQEQSAVKSQFQNDQNAEIRRIQGLPVVQAGSEAQASKFPAVQAIGATLQANLEKRRDLLAKEKLQAGDIGGAANMLSGVEDVNNPSPLKAYPDPTPTTIPDPNDPTGQRKVPMIMSFDKYGRKVLSPATGMTTIVNAPNVEAVDRLHNEQSQLQTRQAQAETAQNTLATAERLTQALQEGAVIGGGADLKQTARKIMQAVGIDTPESGPTDLARTQFGGGMLAQINKLGRNPTDYDEKLMQKLVGSLDTDPNAAPALIAFMTAQAHKTLQDFGDFVNTKRSGTGAATFPGLYDTADNGIRPPKELFGPTALQFKTIEALKQAGGDITRFTDPSTGKPFDPNSKFDIRAGAITAPKVTIPTAPAAEAQIYVNPTTGERGTLTNGVWTLLPKQ